MVDWTSLISRNRDVVLGFATGSISAKSFENAFAGNPNPARNLVRTKGTNVARQLTRKALRRRGVNV